MKGIDELRTQDYFPHINASNLAVGNIQKMVLNFIGAFYASHIQSGEIHKVK